MPGFAPGFCGGDIGPADTDFQMMTIHRVRRLLRSVKSAIAAARPARRAGQAPRPAFDRDDCQTPYLLFARPGTLFASGEDILVSVFNPDRIPLEIVVIGATPAAGKGTLMTIPWKSNPTRVRLAHAGGPLQLVAREVGAPPRVSPIRSNSIRASIVADNEHNRALIEADRVSQHKLHCAVQFSSTGVLTLHDPWITPGHATYPAAGDWFPTPVWEGCTPLYNEEPEYYRDPLRYFLDCIALLRSKGYVFYTWHDLIDDSVDASRPGVLLQFDLDGGPRSFLRVAAALDEMQVVATGMLHYRARHWYEYDFEDIGIEKLEQLERRGWALGYHHNALTNLSGVTAADDESEAPLQQAAADLCRDLEALRKSLHVRTLTHHGGNQLNYRVPIPETADVICVDRQFSPELWRPITRSFSDGGFTARPVSLKNFVETAAAEPGLLFLRCHPFKYGNYPDGLDLAPLTESKADLPHRHALEKKCATGERLDRMEKQAAWLQSRRRTRSGVQLGYAGYEKPLSAQFIASRQIDAEIARLRAQRRPGFLRQYPWAGGDPRVVWWRLLSTFCKAGDVLNVGAMPPEQKHETRTFLHPDSTLLEVDIEPAREPDILADFCDPEFSLERNFDHVLLNGLPYFSDPLAAVGNAGRHLAHNGSLLIGAAAASHPERGGLFRPEDRPMWRPGRVEHQGESLSLGTMLWSFDDEAIAGLMSAWPGSWKAEFIFHYWFVVAYRE